MNFLSLEVLPAFGVSLATSPSAWKEKQPMMGAGERA